jgi:hypothetical protein
MALFQGLLQGGLFYKVGQADKISNFVGLAFLVSSDQFITMSFG